MKTHRDDALRIRDGTEATDEVCDWLDSFQRRINEVLGSEHMKFTAEIWNPEAQELEIPKNKKVSMNRNVAFTYLDIEMYWYQEESLSFKVHRKPNQILNYVSRDSTHTKHCHASILNGVIRMLSTITTVTDENKNLTIDTLCPDYAEALIRAGLVSKELKLPTI